MKTEMIKEQIISNFRYYTNSQMYNKLDDLLSVFAENSISMQFKKEPDNDYDFNEAVLRISRIKKAYLPDDERVIQILRACKKSKVIWFPISLFPGDLFYSFWHFADRFHSGVTFSDDYQKFNVI